MRILITGIDGFVGRHLRQILSERGHEVTGIDRNENSGIRCDLEDRESVLKILADCRPDTVIHLAAVSRVDFEQPDLLYRINVNGTVNLLSAVVRLEQVPRLLLVSSSQVYGNPVSNEQPVQENCAVVPVNHYGASKAATESIARAFAGEYGMPLVIVRPFNHTGRGQTINFVVPKIVNAFRDRKDKLDLGNIDTIRDFLDVRDVCEAYCMAVEKFQDGEVYNVASGRGVRIRDVIDMCEEITGHHLRINRMETLFRHSEIRSILGSAEHITRDLSWKARYSFSDTLRWMLQE